MKCPTCGKDLQRINERHLTSKQHEAALKRRGLSVQDDPARKNLDASRPSTGASGTGKTRARPVPAEHEQFSELLVFTYINAKQSARFGEVQTFLATFGVSTSVAVATVLNLYAKGLLRFSTGIDEDYQAFIDATVRLFSRGKFPAQVPASFSIKDFHDLYETATTGSRKDMVDFLERLSTRHPGSVSLSSSHAGGMHDLITVSSVFSDRITFVLDGAWRTGR